MPLELTAEEFVKEISFKPNNEIEGFQTWKPDHQEECMTRLEKLPDEEEGILTWLEKPCGMSGALLSEASVKFLLVPASFDFDCYPRGYKISQTALQNLLSAIHAPGFFLYAALRARIHCAQLPNIVTPDGRTLMSRTFCRHLEELKIDFFHSGYCLVHSTRLGAIFWTYDPISFVTRGVFLYYNRNVMLEVLRDGLAKNQKLISSPHIVSIISVAHLIRKVDELRIEEREILGKAEMLSGFHEYERALWAEPARAMPRRPLDGIDFGTLSIKMSGSAANLARLEMTVEVLKKLLAVIEGKDNNTRSPSTDISSENTTYAEKTVRDKARFLSSYSEYQLSDIKYLQRRVQIQLTAIFNLTAQRDQNLSIQIAKDSRSLAISSKRDSTSMKTIAAVTMVFLPGTFVATLLALPSFEWDPIQHISVRRDFWIYWVITIPLTFLTLLIWFVWGKWKAQVDLQAENEARDAITTSVKQENRDDSLPGIESMERSGASSFANKQVQNLEGQRRVGRWGRK